MISVTARGYSDVPAPSARARSWDHSCRSLAFHPLPSVGGCPSPFPSLLEKHVIGQTIYAPPSHSANFPAILSKNQGYSSLTRRPSYDLVLALLRPHVRFRPDDVAPVPVLPPLLPRPTTQNSTVAISSAAHEPQAKPNAHAPSDASRPSARKALRALTKVALFRPECQPLGRGKGGGGGTNVINATATLPKNSATPATSPATALPRRPQHARKLVKKAAVSKKSVIRYMTVPKRHMYQ